MFIFLLLQRYDLNSRIPLTLQLKFGIKTLNMSQHSIMSNVTPEV